MRPVMQTKFETDRTAPDAPASWGDCFPACVASILELDISEVPTFVAVATEKQSWFLLFEEWARERGLGIVAHYPTDGSQWYVSPGVHGIANGPSPRGDWQHSVVIDETGQIAHDPRPEGGGLAAPATEIFYLIPLAYGRPA